MTETPSQAEPSAAPEPAAAEEQVTIGLGPDLGIYPEELRPPEPAEPAATEKTSPEALESAATPSPADAGPGTDSDGQGSRRQRGQEAYERGLAEGRATIEREYAQAQARAQAEATSREATQRVETLFAGLESPDRNVQDQARRGILQLYRGNQQANALQSTTRQQILLQMAQDFAKLRGADGIDDAAYDQLHTANNAVELAQRAVAIGKKSRDDEIAKLQAELTQLRGRLVGRTATPQPANGLAGGAPGITWDQYITMTPAEARKLSARQIDAITAEHFRELATNGRS